MEKRGSALVGFVIVLIGILSLVILTLFVLLIQDVVTDVRIGQSSQVFDVISRSVVYDGESLHLTVVKRGGGDDIIGLRFILSNNAGDEYIHEEDVSLANGESVDIVIPTAGFIEDVSRVSVFPIFIEERTQEIFVGDEITYDLSDDDNDGIITVSSSGGGSGGSSSESQNDDPVAFFTANMTTGANPLDVLFDASGSSDSDGTITTYAWSFGDGEADSGSTVTHLFGSEGTFNVILTVTDDSGDADNYNLPIVVSDTPRVTINSPLNTAVLSSGDVSVQFSIVGFNVFGLGEDHVNFYLDSDTIPYEFYNGGDDVVNYGGSPSVNVERVDGNLIRFLGLSDGPHVITAVLSDGNDVELINPEATAIVNFNINDVPAVCGNGAIEGAEQCDDSNTVDGDGCSAICLNEPCSLVNAVWSTSSSVEGDIVSLSVSGNSNDCEGKVVDFVVNEDDSVDGEIGGDEEASVNPNDATFLGGSATTMWTSEWQCDGDLLGNCLFDNPEYYFTASISNPVDSIRSDDPLLVTIALSPTCGNGIIEGTEICDDGPSGSQTCSTSCTLTICGDGIVQDPNGIGESEVCELTDIQSCVAGSYAGIQNCQSDCSGFGSCVASESCGDSIVNGAETCDDGVNNGNPNSCNLTCDGVTPSTCGNSITEAGETCDDGNSIETDTCSNSCQQTTCGDGFIQFPNGQGASEICDDGINNGIFGFCNSMCSGLTLASCGDGVPEGIEECDDGNLIDGDACTNSCTAAVCGDSITYIGTEECDDGISGSTLCSTICELTICGDSVIQSPNGEGVNEICELSQIQSCTIGGYAGSQDCLATCLGFGSCNPTQSCGDGFVQPLAGETCDDGANNGQPNSCNLTCDGVTTSICGNTIVEAGETCDDGNSIETDTCSNSCSLTTCGDNIIQSPNGVGTNEICDDGSLNGLPNQCNSLCTGTTLASCGNNIVEAGEECDDGNVVDGDSCTNSCTAAVCGDSITYIGTEECDDGVATSQCTAICTLTFCGDSSVQSPNGFGVNEVCELSQTQSCTSGGYAGSQDCLATCLGFGSCNPTESCGDGFVQPLAGETCDDGANNGNPNSCNLTCDGVTPSTCGNSITEAGETCDDGNSIETDTCSNSCSLTTCGDNIIQSPNGVGTNEICDDGSLNGLPNQCNSLCTGTTLASCGNNIVEAGEECDDGNAVDGDSCTNSCTNAICGDSIVHSGVEECDDGFATDQCTAICTLTFCGDSLVQSPNGFGVNEICDGNSQICSVGGYNGNQNCLGTCLGYNVCNPTESCGDGFVQPLAGETCDEGVNNGNPNSCNLTCDGVTTSICGNTIVEAGESCDDGNLDESDVCSNSCTLTICGDDIIQSPNGVGTNEICDDGSLNGLPNQCNSLCTGTTLASCGNSITESGEECDDGDAIDSNDCTNACTVSICGDGITHNLGSGTEECDDLNLIETDSCSNSCSLTVCSDGIIQNPNGFGVNEICDGNSQSCTIGGYSGTQDCASSCLVFDSCITSEFCGDTIVNGPEFCELGDSQSCSVGGYSGTQDCSLDCQNYDSCNLGEFCGDNIVQGAAGETCDDGNNLDNDGCSAICQNECTFSSASWDTNSAIEGDTVTLTITGNNCGWDVGQDLITLETFEDDLVSDTPTLANPFNLIYSVGQVTASWVAEWECDGDVGGVCFLGNPEYFFRASLVNNIAESLDSASNLVVTKLVPICGNGIQESGEQCDDANVVPGDGCDASCQIEPGTFTLSVTGTTSSSVSLSWAAVPNTNEYRIYLSANPGTLSSDPSRKLIATLPNTATSYTVSDVSANTDIFLRFEAVDSGSVLLGGGNAHSKTIGGYERPTLDTPLKAVHLMRPDMVAVVLHNEQVESYEGASGSFIGNTGADWQAGTWTVTRKDGSPIAIELNGVYRHSVPFSQDYYEFGYKAATNIQWLDVEHRIYLDLAEDVGSGEILNIVHVPAVSQVDPALNPADISIDFTLPFSDKYLETNVIQLNQVGYNPRANQRYAYVSSWIGDGGGLDLTNFPGSADVLIDTTGLTPRVVVPETIGTTINVRSVSDSDAGTEVREIDLSSLPASEVVSYRVHIPGVGVSWKTQVSEVASLKAYYVSARGLFLNRWGRDLDCAYTDWCTRPSGPIARDHPVAYTPQQTGVSYNGFFDRSLNNNPPTGEFVLEGGHHDAGDFDIRPFHYTIALDLLKVYEANPLAFTDGQLDIPESSNGIPDLLDEVLYNIKAWETLQDVSGGVSPGVESWRHPWGHYYSDQEPSGTLGNPPDTSSGVDGMPYWKFDVEPKHSGRVAGLFAETARLLKPFDETSLCGSVNCKSDELETKAIDAYNFAIASGLSVPGNQALDGGGNIMHPASELYALTDDPQYKTKVEETWNTWDNFGSGPNMKSDNQGWPGNYNNQPAFPIMFDHVLGYLSGTSPDATIASNFATKLNADANGNIGNLDTHAHRNSRTGNPDWGEGTAVGEWVFGVIAKIQHDGLDPDANQAYFDSLSLSTDYVLGGNPNGMVYITGLGTVSAQDPLHHDSLAFMYDGMEPMPGIPVFGPVNSLSAASYIDYPENTFYPTFASQPLMRRYIQANSIPHTAETVTEMMSINTALFGMLIDGNTAIPASWTPGNVDHQNPLPTSGISDSTPPTIPQNLIGNPLSDTEISLGWDAASDPETGISSYRIYRDSNLAGTSTGTSYTDIGLTASTSYTYTVSAVNTALLEGGKSSSVDVTTNAAPVCGNGVIEGSEVCETNPLDLNGNTCTTIGQGFVGGTLGCNVDCLSFDTTQCTLPPFPVGNQVLHLDFEGDLLDNSGNGNDGSCTNCPDVTSGPDGSGAFDFNGVDDVISVVDNNNGLDLLGPHTLALWVRIDTTDLGHKPDLLTKQFWATYALTKKQNSGFNYYLGGPNNLGSVTVPTSGQGDWYHLTGVYTGSEMKIYVNGQSEGSPLVTTATLSPSTESLLVGSGPNGFLNGALDDVRIFAEAFTDQNVLELYNSYSVTPAVCGNSIIESGEQCDDGCLLGVPNVCEPIDDGDGCSSTCQNEGGGQVCGNGVIEGSEVCETNPLDLNGQTCISQGFDSGTLGCSGNCLSFNTNSCVSVDPNLVLHLPFNGNTLDASGNGNDGSCSNCPLLVADRDSNPNSAYQFNGVNNAITILSDPSIEFVGNDDFTLATWARFDGIVQEDITSAQTILTKQHWATYALSKFGNAGFNFFIGSPAHNVGWLPAGRDPVVNQWYHVVATRESNVMILYVDGVFENSVVDTASMQARPTDALLIGSGANGFLKGTLDDIRIYNRALSAGEVSNLYSGLPLSPPLPSPEYQSKPSSGLDFAQFFRDLVNWIRDL